MPLEGGIVRPKDQYSGTVGKAGAKSLTMVVPSGWMRARYSPSPARRKLVWSSAPLTARFLLEAKTRRKPLAGMMVGLGKRHLVRWEALSVR